MASAGGYGWSDSAAGLRRCSPAPCTRAGSYWYVLATRQSALRCHSASGMGIYVGQLLSVPLGKCKDVACDTILGFSRRKRLDLVIGLPQSRRKDAGEVVSKHRHLNHETSKSRTIKPEQFILRTAGGSNFARAASWRSRPSHAFRSRRLCLPPARARQSPS